MTHKYVCYGASDDLAQVTGSHREEYDATRGAVTVRPHPMFEVRWSYDANNVWAVFPVMVDEDVFMPPGVTFSTHSDPAISTYSVVLVIESDEPLDWPERDA